MSENLSISNLPAIKFDGIYRVLACIPSSPESLEGFKSFSSIRGFGLNPSQWKPIDLSHFKNPIWDQGMTSSCVGQGSGAGMQTCRMQSGSKFKEFNPYFIYGLINNGRDQGAMISDAMRALMKTGACLKNDIKRGQMYKNQFTPTAFESAKRFKLVDAYKCNSFEDICSAITLGFVCPLGILVDQNFPRVDGQGVSPVAAPGRGGGHCILGVGIKKSGRYGWLIKCQNSWGRNFGQSGYSYIHRAHFQFMHPDAFAVQSMINEDGD